MKFSADFLERLKASYSIVDVISPFVTLQRRGRSFWGCCPFHNEKTPSFSVDEVRGIYKCFGCGKGGNHFRFLMDYKNMTFAEAVQYVAEKAHVPMPVAEESEAERRARRQRESGYECLLEAARFYRDKLFDGSCPEIKAYLDGRNLDERTVKVFGLGASPDYDSLIKHLVGKGFSSETMLYCGVAQKNNHGLYDPLAKRLIIPIINAAGKVIGFGGRVLQKTADMAKYKNTIATPIFEKRYNLYGMNIFAKQRAKEAIIVEGYFDLISLYQAGITNAIAPMGTSLTDRQCDILKKYDVKTVYVCFDGDSAGQHATLRSLSMLSERGMEVKVVTIPDDMDPDDAVKKMGREGFLGLMDSARPLVDYRLYVIEQQFPPTDLESRTKYVKEAINVLSELDEVTAAVYVDKVSEVAGVPKDSILSALKNKSQNGSATQSRQPQTATVKPAFVKTEEKKPADAGVSGVVKAGRVVLMTLLRDESVPLDSFVEQMFTSADQRELFGYIAECRGRGKNPSVSNVYDAFPESREVAEVLNVLDGIDGFTAKKMFDECYNVLFKDLRNNTLNELSKQYSKCTDETEREKIIAQVSKISKLTGKR